MLKWKWITSLDRKKHQRLINRAFRKINKDIENDDLWKGRFMIKQTGYNYFEIYEDKSGAELFINYEIIDKKTNKRKLYSGDTNDIVSRGWTIYRQMNDFIIHECKVWEEIPRPTAENTPDYRKVRVI